MARERPSRHGRQGVTIPITKPFFGDEERAALVKPLDSGWVVQGPFVKEFETKFAAFTNAPYAAATSSCTTALHVAVAALGLAPGDEVIVPAFTWVATPNVVEYMRATPVFCDIRIDDFNIDVTQLSTLVTPRTVGIIPVHLFGLCADMPAVLDFARRHRLWIVEDAACALGASVTGRHAGTFGEAGCFSFHPRKSITTGEGGMVTTGREALYRTVCSLRDHGASKSDRERHTSAGGFLLASYAELGFNYRMTDFQGALGSVQMDRAPQLIAARRRVAEKYDERLSRFEWLQRPAVPAGYQHGWQSYVCLFRPDTPSLSTLDAVSGRRNHLMARLEARGVATRQGTHAPVTQPFYQQKYGFRREQFPNACLAEALSISLPIYAQMTDAEIDTVVSELGAAFAQP
jgi:dTDP-4-amino-4,6-dideoxygalactose transaminase